MQKSIFFSFGLVYSSRGSQGHGTDNIIALVTVIDDITEVETFQQWKDSLWERVAKEKQLVGVLLCLS